jgi:hypothetical protein
MSLLDLFRRPSPPSLPASFAEARTRLMPVLRGRWKRECLRLIGADTPPGSLFLPFSSDTVLMLVHDGADVMQPIGQAELAQWGASVDEALGAAIDNLRDATAGRVVQVERRVFAGDWRDAYASSRLLLPDLAHRIAGANPLAMIPAPQTLLLTSGNDMESVRAMVALAQRVADVEAHPVSALMYRYEHRRPVEHVPDDEAVRAGLAHLGRQYLYGDYAAQKELLDALHERKGIDIVVAGYKVMRDAAGGGEYSVCVWPRGVDALLPKTDRVVLSSHGQDLPMLPWDALHATSGHLMEPVPGAWPARYRVSGFPDLAPARKA